jgi:hypothetical protein
MSNLSTTIPPQFARLAFAHYTEDCVGSSQKDFITIKIANTITKNAIIMGASQKGKQGIVILRLVSWLPPELTYHHIESVLQNHSSCLSQVLTGTNLCSCSVD